MLLINTFYLLIIELSILSNLLCAYNIHKIPFGEKCSAFTHQTGECFLEPLLL
jgi:hypothetical protein